MVGCLLLNFLVERSPQERERCRGITRKYNRDMNTGGDPGREGVRVIFLSVQKTERPVLDSNK